MMSLSEAEEKFVHLCASVQELVDVYRALLLLSHDIDYRLTLIEEKLKIEHHETQE